MIQHIARSTTLFKTHVEIYKFELSTKQAIHTEEPVSDTCRYNKLTAVVYMAVVYMAVVYMAVVYMAVVYMYVNVID